jgi:isoleucyl-tRNA synthetase
VFEGEGGEGEDVEVVADEVIVTETPREGWAVASADGETVALDLEITPQLRLAGLARDAVRLIQEARKTAGLEVADRIALRWSAAKPETAEALRAHGAAIADDVLAVEFAEVEDAGAGAGASAGAGAVSDADLGLTFSFGKAAL